MAWRFDASADYLRRTTSLPSVNAFTACGWGMRVVDQNNFSTVFGIQLGTGPEYILLSTNSDGDTLAVWGQGDSVGVTLATLSNNQWFFWALSRDSSGNIVGRYALPTATSLTSATRVDTGGVFTPNTMIWANNNFSEPFNGRLAGLKVWDAVLTAEEIWSERWQLCPVRRANLHLFAPGFRHTELDDMSGNGRTLGVGGTLATEEGPPVPWRIGRRRSVLFLAEGAKIISVGQVSETDLAQTIAWAPKRRLVGQVTESDLAQAIGRLKLKQLGQVTEIDLAQAIIRGGGQTVVVGQVTETDVAQTIGRLKVKALAQVSETDLAQAIGRLKTKTIAQALESDISQAVLWSPKSRLLGQVNEVDLSQAISPRKAGTGGGFPPVYGFSLWV